MSYSTDVLLEWTDMYEIQIKSRFEKNHIGWAVINMMNHTDKVNRFHEDLRQKVDYEIWWHSAFYKGDSSTTNLIAKNIKAIKEFT